MDWQLIGWRALPDWLKGLLHWFPNIFVYKPTTSESVWEPNNRRQTINYFIGRRCMCSLIHPGVQHLCTRNNIYTMILQVLFNTLSLRSEDPQSLLSNLAWTPWTDNELWFDPLIWELSHPFKFWAEHQSAHWSAVGFCRHHKLNMECFQLQAFIKSGQWFRISS